MKENNYSLPRFKLKSCVLNALKSNLLMTALETRLVIEEALQAMADIFSLPEVAANIPSGLGPVLKTVPASARTNVYCHPWQLDLSEEAKYGQVGKYPSMVQVRAHLPSVVWKGYRSESEALEVKFNQAAGETIDYYSIKYIDGHCKGIMCQTILALVVDMATWRCVMKYSNH